MSVVLILTKRIHPSVPLTFDGAPTLPSRLSLPLGPLFSPRWYGNGIIGPERPSQRAFLFRGLPRVHERSRYPGFSRRASRFRPGANEWSVRTGSVRAGELDRNAAVPILVRPALCRALLLEHRP